MLYHMPMQLGRRLAWCREAFLTRVSDSGAGWAHSGLLVLEGELLEPWTFRHLLRGGQALGGASQRAHEF